jgi:hypothetical protein
MNELHTANGGRQVHEGHTSTEWDDIPPTPSDVIAWTFATVCAAIGWGSVIYLALGG